jgi:very-short-patch-repair endonuclease
MRKKRRPTAYAQRLIDALAGLGIKVHPEFCDKHKCIDIAIHSARLDIEVDGTHHLTSTRQILADLNREYYSEKAGYATIHIPNRELDEDLAGIAKAIAGAARIREEKIHKYGRN